MLETLGFSKVFRNLAEVRNGNLVPLTDPFLDYGSDTSLRKPQPKNAAFQIISFRMIRIFVHVLGIGGGVRRQQPREAAVSASTAYFTILKKINKNKNESLGNDSLTQKQPRRKVITV